MTSTDPIPSLETRGRVLHWAAAYDFLVWLLLFGRERAFRERTLDLAQLRPGERVLDIGCGTGTLAILAKAQVGAAGEVHGMDASPAMVARARRKARTAGAPVEFRAAIVEALPYPDAHFDVVLSTLMMHHLPRDVREVCVKEVRRVLKPGGRFLTLDFGPDPDGKGIIGHVHRHGHLDIGKIRQLVTDAGFDIAASGPAGVRNLHFALATRP